MHINVKRKTKDSDRGITLIALVITIIIMLILAGVAISMAIDSNGLFGKANTAGESWNTAVENERSELQDLLDIIDGLNLPAGWDAKKIASTVTETSEVAGITKERIVPIPKGYTVSGISTEDTIAGGLVIYERTEPVTGEKNSTAHITAMETRNQYVWIPVDDINQMVMCKSNNVDADVDGNKICNLQLVNGVLQCTNTGHTENKTNLCGRLYGQNSTTTDTDTTRIFTTNMNFSDKSQTWNPLSFREPDVLSNEKDDVVSGKNYMETAGITDGTVATFSNQLITDFTKMATSVAKYKGFYVSRYEAGENGISQKNKKALTGATSALDSDNYLAGNMWYGLYNTLRNTTIVDKSIVNTHMIWRKSV